MRSFIFFFLTVTVFIYTEKKIYHPRYKLVINNGWTVRLFPHHYLLVYLTGWKKTQNLIWKYCSEWIHRLKISQFLFPKTIHFSYHCKDCKNLICWICIGERAKCKSHRKISSANMQVSLHNASIEIRFHFPTARW